MSLRTLKIVGLTVTAMAVGCAHNQAKVAAKPASPMPVVTADKEGKDAETLALESFLRGTVTHFDFDRDSLTDEGQTKLQKVAQALKTHPRTQVRIAGHCDELGTEEYNIALGQRRAEVAKKYLVALGVDSTRIDTVSFGEEKPAVSGHDEQAWAANRRDELEPDTK